MRRETGAGKGGAGDSGESPAAMKPVGFSLALSAALLPVYRAPGTWYSNATTVQVALVSQDVTEGKVRRVC